MQYSEVTKQLLHLESISVVKHLFILHEIDTEEHIFSRSDELLSNCGCFLKGFKLGVLLASVQSFLVRVNLCFDLAFSDQLSQLLLYDLKGHTESIGDLSHVDDFIRFDVLLQSQVSDLLEHLIRAMLPKQIVIFQLGLDRVQLSLELFISAHHEVV